MNIFILKPRDVLYAESYIWWIIVDSAVPYSSEELRNIWKSYVNKLMKKEMSESKSTFCATAVTQLMGMYVHKIWYRNDSIILSVGQVSIFYY